MTNPIGFSSEQLTYINNADTTSDTKLLAIAGSGKTRCIIARMQHLIKFMGISPQSIVSVTFSKNAQQDFIAKVRSEKMNEIETSNIFTIDSLAWRSLDPTTRDSTDVTILSYTFMVYLQKSSRNQILETDTLRDVQLRDVRHIFVDEAQDLNQTQYNILVEFRDKLGIVVHMVGDPSQNIFQFRNSSDKFMLDFEALTFRLSKNFRSCPQIVKFSSYLRPHKDHDAISSHKPVTKSIVKMVSVRDTDDFETAIMSVVNTYIRLEIPLEKCAIISPTRGKIRDTKGLPSYVGLCYAANLLYQHGIPFNQFYGELIPTSKVKYKPVKGSINLMTYHGSKGLEWNNVIVIDANAYLVSRYGYNVSNFISEQYLLYVACSRACTNMVIVTKVGMSSPWFEVIPKELYMSTGLSVRFFDKSRLEFKSTHNETGELCHLKKVLSDFDEKTLYEFAGFLSSVECEVTNLLGGDEWGTAKIYDESKRMLLSFVIETYFLLCVSNMIPSDFTLFNDLKNILAFNLRTTILCNIPAVSSWYFENKSLISWSLYDALQQKARIDPVVHEFVTLNFDRSQEFGSHSLVDKFHFNYISKNIAEIKKCCNEYLSEPYDFTAVCKVSAINFAISTHNFFLIEQIENLTKIVCTPHVLKVAGNIRKLCSINETHKWNSNKVKLIVCSKGAQGVVDSVDKHDVSVTVKCIPNVSLSHVLEALMSDMLRGKDIIKKINDTKYKFIIYNLFDGKKHAFNADLDEGFVKRLQEYMNFELHN